MAQTRLKLGVRRVGARSYWQLTIPRRGGGRIRKTFESRTTARREFKRLKKEIDLPGVSALAMSDLTRAEAIEGQTLLAPPSACLNTSKDCASFGYGMRPRCGYLRFAP
jgi:hypothetical protein